ncbi:MAG: glycosyltransferase [Acidobacteria bacterium]|nr:glycosyltransferase [Acidobacteriota bacterium]
MGGNKVTIIILTWNGLAYTKRCLETLRGRTAFNDYEVVVVDNGSTDGTVEYLRSLPWLRLLENRENLGFVRGNNRALAESVGDSDFVLLNNDTEIVQPDWLSRLQATAYGAPEVGIVGARLRRPDGMLQHAGTYMPIETFWGQQLGAGEKDVNQFNADAEVEGVVFACAYIKREVYERVGPLDEDYFSYFEDSDYCLKARSQGFKVFCCGSATIVHHENTSTKVNKVSFEHLFLESQKTFRRKWQAALESSRYTLEVNWHSLLNFPTGYANSSRELVLELDRQGVRVNYRYLYGPGTAFARPEPEQSTSYMVNVIRGRRVNPSGVHVSYGQGDSFRTDYRSYKIGYTMLEVDGLPREWVRRANLMDEVWTPSSFNADTFRASGVESPVHVMPLGVNPAYFNPNIEGYPVPGVYTFLSAFEWGERKAPEVLLRAFNDEFRAGEQAVLVCKVYNQDASVNVPRQVSRLGLKDGGGRVVFSINEVVPAHQLGALYRSADCFVLPSRGEGWGLPVLEAMACGLPVIATAWSAQTDFMNDRVAYPLRVEGLVPAEAKCPYYEGFNWAEPSYEHLRQLLRHVFENREEARLKGARASAEVLGRWTWRHSAEKIIRRLREVG